MNKRMMIGWALSPLRLVLLCAIAVVAGVAVGSSFPDLPRHMLDVLGMAPSPRPETPADGQPEQTQSGGKPPGTAKGQEAAPTVRMTPEQVSTAAIRTARVGAGILAKQIQLPATITADADRLAMVPAKVSGTVSAVHRRPGDRVHAGEVLAIIESRDMAEAKGEYLTALRAEQLARVTYQRETVLWRHKVSAEQDYLKARNDADAASIRVRLGRQRLAALGLSREDIDDVPRQPIEDLRLRPIRAPIAGQITARMINAGSTVQPETQTFEIADLSAVWVEMAVPPADLLFIKEGATVSVTSQNAMHGDGRIIFITPQLDPNTRNARVTAELAEANGQWPPGSFAMASIAAAGIHVPLAVPDEALQMDGDKTVVFVRTKDGFEQRTVTAGQTDHRLTQIVSGLQEGETIATGNSFVIKAELRKGEAGDDE